MLSVSTAPVPVAQEKAAPGARDTEFAVVADPLAPGNTNKVSVALTGFSTKHPRRVADAAMADWKVPPAVTVLELSVVVPPVGFVVEVTTPVDELHNFPVVSIVTG